jgi:hypothetical protein
MEQGLLSSESKFSTSGIRCHEAMFRYLTGGNAYRGLDDAERAKVATAIEKLEGMIPELEKGVVMPDGSAKGLWRNGEWYAERKLPCKLTSSVVMEEGSIDFYAVDRNYLTLVDFKFGASYVPNPKWNLQIQDYVLAVACEHGMDRPCLASIIQPDAPEQAGYTFMPEQYAPMSDAIRAIRDAAYHPDAPLYPGKACQYCLARPTCPARTQEARILDADLSTLTPDQRGEIVSAVKLMSDVSDERFKALKTEIESEGHIVTGWDIIAVGGARAHTRLVRSVA